MKSLIFHGWFHVLSWGYIPTSCFLILDISQGNRAMKPDTFHSSPGAHPEVGALLWLLWFLAAETADSFDIWNARDFLAGIGFEKKPAIENFGFMVDDWVYHINHH